ncbi:uncharacterized protein LOC122852212 [Aphidius gifuensis]|uniref:uncharacterized protein LOC122852212 n=1 Tax=Aphidius gifuensis TaxID=684658 RepID=UPI001CDD8426|nr:uncharacterized protein LOC122852212 [Aphidius gifuensis]
MPHPCVVCGRSRMNPNNRKEDYMFFGFPVNNDDRCKKWLEFCSRDDLYKLNKKQLSQRMICSKHFIKNDFVNEFRDRLTCTAVPTIYDPKQSLYNITCLICGKTRNDPPLNDDDVPSFHHFPGEEFRCLKWLDFVGVDSYYRLTRKEILYCYICSRHFAKSQFKNGYKNRLINNAIPSIKNPDIDINNDEYINNILINNDDDNDDNDDDDDNKTIIYEPLSKDILESKACASCGRLRIDPLGKSHNYKFHPFPAYEIGRCLKWCQFLGREDLLKMSPNQIRKLVLCSRHFMHDQTFKKFGPCDAVPTIKYNTTTTLTTKTNDKKYIHDNIDDIEEFLKSDNFNILNQPIISSKKPHIDDKPAPLAKKRGKQKRSTFINIPKPKQNDNKIFAKLPLPPTTCNNWRFQIPNQYHPITISNNITTTSLINDNNKKIILPFTGNISNFGTPIPVSSLSCIPPGLLFKIDLPQKEKIGRGRPSKKKQQLDYKIITNIDNKNYEKQFLIDDNVTENLETDALTECMEEDNQIIEQLEEETEYYDEQLHDYDNTDIENFIYTEERLDSEPEYIQEEILDVKMQDNNEQLIEESNQDYKIEYIDDDNIINNDDNMPTSTDIMEMNRKECRKKRKNKSTPTCRRTILPIKQEVNYFFKKLKPLFKKLPRKSKAHIKLAIVNMVDQL